MEEEEEEEEAEPRLEEAPAVWGSLCSADP